jgi:hypothetical protein
MDKWSGGELERWRVGVGKMWRVAKAERCGRGRGEVRRRRGAGVTRGPDKLRTRLVLGLLGALIHSDRCCRLISSSHH